MVWVNIYAFPLNDLQMGMHMSEVQVVRFGGQGGSRWGYSYQEQGGRALEGAHCPKSALLGRAVNKCNEINKIINKSVLSILPGNDIDTLVISEGDTLVLGQISMIRS